MLCWLLPRAPQAKADASRQGRMSPALLAPGPAPHQGLEVPLSPCFQKETTDKAVTRATSRAGAVARTDIVYASKGIQAQQPGRRKKKKKQIARLIFAEISA